ncbi:MAG: RNA chaperone Hfq [Alphaproteobacteria bacterium]|nr:RNA chaperone Hfq [Alphaproteobacteria bacterium]
MSEKIINIQDAFLNYMRKNKIPVTIFLLNGVKISGIISCFDQSTIVIKREGYTQLLYKHAISTFSPHGAVSVFDWNSPQSTREKQDISENIEEFDNESIEYFEDEEN